MKRNINQITIHPSSGFETIEQAQKAYENYKKESEMDKSIFTHLDCKCITTCMVNSDNEPINGTEQEKVIFYNKDHVSEEMIDRANGETLWALKEMGKIIIIDKDIALNLIDKEETINDK